MVEAAIRRGYEVTAAGPRHPTGEPVATGGPPSPSALAAAVAIAVATRSWIVVAVAAAVVAVVGGRARPVVLVVLLAGCAVVRSDAAWAGLAPDHVGPFHGWAGVVVEPQRYAGATRVLLEIEGERHEVWVRGRARQQRVADWRAGDQVLVDGRREPLDHDRAQRVAWQHVVGVVRAVVGRRPASGRPRRRRLQPGAGR